MDIRLDAGFLTHPKTLRLERLHGERAVLALIRLWTWVAANRPDGNLAELEDTKVEAKVGFRGLLSLLAQLGFIDGPPLERRVHDWHDHQPWVANRPEREASARRAANARWDAERMRGASKQHDAPSPSPSPSPPESGVSVPFGRPQGTSPPNGAEPPSGGREPYPPGFLRAWSAYPHFQQRSKKAESAAVWKRLKLERYADSVVQWIEAGKRSHDWTRDGGSVVAGMQVWLKGRDFRDTPATPDPKPAAVAPLRSQPLNESEKALRAGILAKRDRREAEVLRIRTEVEAEGHTGRKASDEILKRARGLGVQ